MVKQSVKDLALLMEEEVLERALLLLVKQLLHDLQEVASKNGQRVLIFIKELA